MTIKSGVGDTAACFSFHPEPLAHTNTIRKEEKGGAGSRMFSSEHCTSLNSTAAERSNDLTLDGDGNVGINGIPGGGLELRVASPAQFETGGKSQTAGLEEIMR